MASDLLSDVSRFILRERLLRPGQAVRVAVSGGVDSMVLLHVLESLGYPCQVVHVDHGLRGAESTADHDFVERFCTERSLPFRSVTVDAGSLAATTAASVQMAARELRYAWFEELHAEAPMPCALGHHRDDAIETLFLNLLRGTGVHGWMGIPPLAGPFVRPMLCVARDAIVAYACRHSVPFREDRSNQDPKYLRNRVRHELLPLLEDLRPGARATIARSLSALRDMQDAALPGASEEQGRLSAREGMPFCVPCSTLDDSAHCRIAVNLLLRPLGFHPGTIERMLEAAFAATTGAMFQAGQWQVCVDRKGLIVQHRAATPPSYLIDPEDVSGSIGPFHWQVEQGPVAGGSNTREVVLDMNCLSFPLEVRPWGLGDRMRPKGLGGSKLVSDILIDAKVPLVNKANVQVVVCEGTIVWLVGYRVAEGFLAAPETPRVLRIRYMP